MADITSTNPVLVSKLMENIQTFRYNPSSIQRSILQYLEEITSGQVNILDPTNPFIFLLGASCVNTAAAMAENRINLKKLYPKLSQTNEDLYIHMSDKDFVNLFATPASTKFTWMIQYNSLVSNMVEDTAENCSKATIPRNSSVTVDNITFSLQYPVDIRLYSNGELQVTYDGTKASPLQTLSTNVIPVRTIVDSSNVKWLIFETEMFQFDIKTTYSTVQASSLFQESITFDDSFYYCRVFYRNGNNLAWSEMNVTLTDQVYDILKPTAVIKPNNQTKSLNIFIPPVYISSNLIDGDVRVDIYQTKGKIQLDTSNFNLGTFKSSLKAVDEDNDITVFSNAFNNISYLAYSANFVSGGTDGLDFLTLREQVITNASGPVNPPITNVELDAEANIDGFDIVKNVDIVTNRIFLATQSLPSPSNTNLVTAANLTISTFITNMDKLKLLDSVADNTNRLTILSKTLYKSTNGQLSIVSQTDVERLKLLPLSALCSNINSNSYLYSPFYYVLDNKDNEFEVRPYHLDVPVLKNLSFVSQNATAGIQVNTNTYAISKVDTGYKIAIRVTSDSFYKELLDKYLQVQLCFIPPGEINYAYINGTLQGVDSETGERIFVFDIETNWDLNSDDELIITNFEMFSNESTKCGSPLTNTFTILWTTNSVPLNFIPDSSNSIKGSFLLPDETIVVTREEIDITFGYSLKNLWNRSRSIADSDQYLTYDSDIPLTYEENVYKIDPITKSEVSFDADGNPFITKLHAKGDYVLDTDGNIIYKHRAGDIKLDSSGIPIPTSSIYTSRMIDILLVDGAYYFTTDSAHKKYRSEIANTLNTWITTTLSNLQNKLLDKTEIYYHPTTAIGSVEVQISHNNVTTIEARQSFAVTLFVTTSVYDDSSLRQQLKTTTVKKLNEGLQKTTISIDDIIVSMKEAFGQSVISVEISGLGGKANYNSLTLLNRNETLSLNKVLLAQDDGSLIVSEAVDVQFIEYSA